MDLPTYLSTNNEHAQITNSPCARNNACDGATERTRGKQRNNETHTACTPWQIMERILIILNAPLFRI